MRILVILFAAFILSGCAWFSKKPDKPAEIRYVQVPYNIPTSLLTKCKAERPIDKDTYMKMSPMRREEYLVIYSVTLLSNLKDCDNKIGAVKDYTEKMDTELKKK